MTNWLTLAFGIGLFALAQFRMKGSRNACVVAAIGGVFIGAAVYLP